MPEQLDEPFDARIPETFVRAEPVVGAFERPRVDAAVVHAPAHGALHQARPLEGLDVFRRRGERHPVRCGEVAHRLFTLGEPLEHRSPGVVGEGAKDDIESGLTFNHIVEHIAGRGNCQRFG